MTTQGPPTVTPSTGRAVPDQLIGVGYVAALFLPIVGFVIGVVVLAKGESKHGVGMMVLAAVVAAAMLNRYY